MTLFEMEHTYSVLELSETFQQVLTLTFPTDLWVRGEVRNIRRPRSGHVYFDLVDTAPEPGSLPDAVLSVVLFSGTKQVVNTQIKRAGGGMRIDDGVAVRIRAVPDFYPPQGRLQLRMTGIDPDYTIGQMAASRDRLLQRLGAEGLLDRQQLLDIPAMPLRIGLVTAAGSAAEADFLHELELTGICFDVVHAITAVQGLGAEHRVAAAIEAVALRGVSLIAVVRGGGARTDLVAFDTEVVARAIALCPVPVLTGIGHEIDSSVADATARLATKTPTACAAEIASMVHETEAKAELTWEQLRAAATTRLDQHHERISNGARRAGDSVGAALARATTHQTATIHSLRDVVSRQMGRSELRLTNHWVGITERAGKVVSAAAVGLNRQAERLEERGAATLTAAHERVERAALRARLLDPANALARGWSITTTGAGDVVRSVADVTAGTELTTRVVDGRIVSIVGASAPEHTHHQGSESR